MSDTTGSPTGIHEITFPPYIVAEEHRPDPWSKKSTIPKMHTRRISFDSVMTRTSSHSRSPSVDSFMTGRRKLQKSPNQTSRDIPPSSWSPSRLSADKPLPSLPIWQQTQRSGQMSEDERQQRLARVNEARADWIRRDQLEYVRPRGAPTLGVRPSMPDFGDSFVLERPRRRGTVTAKKGWRFYCDAFVNYRESRRNSKASTTS